MKVWALLLLIVVGIFLTGFVVGGAISSPTYTFLGCDYRCLLDCQERIPEGLSHDEFVSCVTSCEPSSP